MSAFPSGSLQARSESCSQPGLFSWHRKSDGFDSVSLRLLGEVDLANRDELRYALKAAERSASFVTVDLTELAFIDGSALACLHETASRMSWDGKGFTVTGAAGQVQRVLDLTGGLPEAKRLRDEPGLNLAPSTANGEAAESEGLRAL